MTASHPPLDWQLVKEAAGALGVTSNTFQQWKSRGWVPHRWRLPIIRQTDGKIPAEAFEASQQREADASQREAAE